ncbi:hypothetical protein DFH94DRAFT_767863 [Russula ochroleuca]|uniref:Uncharacterized protein n=1 Tax=Russula ochroleuca TaxID=152965 RepID=A0A9P5JYX9_9AGAM|nr:hypothetical protein DFH94DRAFT_767863 [Russula ochroleuca]
MPLTFASSELVAISLESVLYGLYFSLFASCVKVLYNKRRRRGGGNYRLILVSTTLFVLITWHLVIDIVRLYLAFEKSETDQGADLYYVRVTAPLSVVKTAIYLAETVVSDLFILYRCYVVWNASVPIIVLPILLYLADIGTGIGAVYTLTLVGQNVVFNKEQERITNSFFSCTLALNAVCTGLIAFRIWRTQRQTNDAKIGSNLMQVSVIVIESGAFHLFPLSLRPCEFHTFVIANRSDLSKRVSMCGRKLHDQVASLQHLFGYHVAHNCKSRVLILEALTYIRMLTLFFLSFDAITHRASSSRLLLYASAAASAPKRLGRRPSRYRTRCLRKLPRRTGRGRMVRSSSGRRQRHSSRTRKRRRARSSRAIRRRGCSRWNFEAMRPAPSAHDVPFSHPFLHNLGFFFALPYAPSPPLPRWEQLWGKFFCWAQEVGVVPVRSRLIAN